MKKIALTLLILYGMLANAQKKALNYAVIQQPATEAAIIKTAANITPSDRQLKWQQLELTAFIHFGINTFTNKAWGDGKESPALFNPVNLDARQWVRTLKAAGFKLVIFTAKHHDGFCLWPSKYTDHSVKSSPWKNGKGDVVKEVAEACKEYGVRFGVYLSPWDMNSVYYGQGDAYNQYYLKQLKELLTNYGRIDEVWLDGANGEGPNGKKQEYDFESWYALIRKLQPQAVIASQGPDVRWVGTETGYGRLTEWSVVPVNNMNTDQLAEKAQKNADFAPRGNMMDDDLGSRSKISKASALVWYPAETDVSIRPEWFYHPEEDSQVKSSEKLIDIYFSSVGRNGVLLLNVPPDTRGLMHENDIKSLQGFRQFLDKTFQKNLAAGASVKADKGVNAASVLDNRFNTYYTTTGVKDTTAMLSFNLRGLKTFDVISLQENITKGQRIESFYVEYKNKAGVWEKIAEGTTVGYKRLLRLEQPVTAREIKLHITASRLNPTLSSFGLYLVQ